jgi:hypothetical protein
LLANWDAVRRVRRTVGRPAHHAASIVADVPEAVVAQLRVLPEQSSSAVHERIVSPVEYVRLNPGPSDLSAQMPPIRSWDTEPSGSDHD